MNFKTLFLEIWFEPLTNIKYRKTLEMKLWPLMTIHNEVNERYIT